jgi:FkbM family methyltransferase
MTKTAIFAPPPRVRTGLRLPMAPSGNSCSHSIFWRIWFSESSSVGRRLKQFIAFIVPRALLIAAKKRYYAALLENPTTPREADMEALNYIVRSGDFALDIGAFVGFYTQRLSQLVGPTGEVWAFEPVPETFSVLSYVVRELSLNNVRVLNFALSDSDGEAVMEIPKYRYGGESLYAARIVSTRPSPHLRAIPIQERTLDSMLSRGGASRRTVRFMKLDVEFHELQTVCGAIDTIRRDQPVILMELLGTDPSNSRLKLLQMLAIQGYKAFRSADGKFVPCAPDENCQNRFFLTQTHVDEFAQYVRWD